MLHARSYRAIWHKCGVLTSKNIAEYVYIIPENTHYTSDDKPSDLSNAQLLVTKPNLEKTPIIKQRYVAGE